MHRRHWQDFDIILFVVMLAIISIGIFSIYSATYYQRDLLLTLTSGTIWTDLMNNYSSRQVIWSILGMCIFFVLISIHYQKILDASYFIYVLNILILISVFLLARERLGAQRWLTLGGFNLQPSEFMKLSFIITLAFYLGKNKEAHYGIRSLFAPILIAAIPFLLILKQPDLGTALVFIPILFTMLYVWGSSIKHLIIFGFIGLASSPILWHILRDYQKKRLLVFLNPNIDPLGTGYTVIQSKIAVGSGGFFGRGWLSGTQNQLNFLPERHTDFIFSVIGEEWGIVGSVVLLILYFVLIWKATKIVDRTNDIYGKLLAAGIAAMLAAQVIINISMTIGLMPVVGITLPLVSYGGSSLITTIIALGILFNVKMRRTVF